MKLKTTAFYWVLATLLPVFLVYQALAFPIEEYSYDTAEFHIYRSVVYSAARADGWLFPRWVQPINAGLGGPFFSLYPPLTYSLMDLLHLVGIPLPVTWRILVALACIAASVGMFGLGTVLLKRADWALAGAAIFVYSGFLLRDLFERGAPSGLALALFPAMLWLLVRFVQGPSGLRLLLASFCLAAIILLHSQTAFLLMPLAGIVIAFLFVRDGFRAAAWSLIPLCCGVLLSSFYMLPFPIEIKNVQFDNALQIDYADALKHPLRLEDVLTLPSNLDIGIGNNKMGVSPDGLLQALALPLGLMLTWRLIRQKRKADALLVGGLAALGFVLLWMQFESANPVWSVFPMLDVFLFRWRLLGVLGIISAIIIGYALEQLPLRVAPTALAALAALAALVVVYIALHVGLVYPELFYHYARFAPSPSLADVQASAIEHRAFGLSSFDEFLPTSRDAPLDHAELTRAMASPLENLPAGGRIVEQIQRTGLLQLTIDSPVRFLAAFHILYYPGWAGYVDGRSKILMPEDSKGYILMDLPAGIHTLALKYEGTSIQHIGDAVTVIACVALLVLAVLWRRRKQAIPGSAVFFPEPRWSIVVLVLLALSIKAIWIDSQTTLFRKNSSCAAIEDAQIQTDVWFGDRLRLCGLALGQTQVRAGDPMSVTLYWQLDQPVTKPANAFVHLLGSTVNPESGNPLWGQQDKDTPGEHALSQWTTGKLFRDEYEFRVPLHTPPGEYQLEIGWRQPSDDERWTPRIVRPLEPLSVSSVDSLLFSGITVR